MLDRDFVPGGPIRNQIKDLDAALAAAANAKLKLPMLEVVRTAFAGLKDSGASGYDHSAAALARAAERARAGRHCSGSPAILTDGRRRLR